MSKAILSLLAALVLTGNAVTIALLVQRGPLEHGAAGGAGEAGVAIPRLEEAITSLRAEVEELSSALREAPRGAKGTAPAAAAERDHEVLQRLAAIEKRLAENRGVDEELAAARLREERETRFLANDGYTAADELVAEHKFALAGNGYLTFLKHHPDHPETRDLMGKARDAFLSAGYTEKAFSIHRELMSRFPESGGKDMMSLALMEKDARRFDDAIQHAEEAARLASIEEDRVWRLIYRAWFVQLRDGDAAGLQAYREVEGLAQTLGMAEKNPGKKVREKIVEIEGRLAQGR